MKISNKLVVQITYQDVVDKIHAFQRDQIREIVAHYFKGCKGVPGEFVDDVTTFTSRLIEGTDSEWFQNLVEDAGVPWLEVPMDAREATALIENYPNTILGDKLSGDISALVHERDLGGDDAYLTFEVFYEHTLLSSRVIYRNI